MIAITFPDGKIKTYNKGITGMEVARGITGCQRSVGYAS